MLKHLKATFESAWSAKGGLEFCPIEDEKNVDKKGKTMGLPPLDEYVKQFGLEYPGK